MQRITYIFGVFLILFGVASAQSMTRGTNLPAYYDVRDGNLTIDTTYVTGGQMIAYFFDALGRGGFRPEEHTRFMDTFVIASSVDQIAETDFGGHVGGVYSLGSVLPPGLSEEELEHTYFGVDKFGFEGTPSQSGLNYYSLGALGSGSFHLFEPIYSPSPHPAINDADVGPTEVEQWAEEVTLFYEASSGSLKIDATGELGGAILSYQISLSTSVFDLNAFMPAGELEPTGLRDDVLTEISFSGIPEGVHNLGSVLPPDLSETELFAVLNKVHFMGEPGHSIEALDIRLNGIAMSVVHNVPEPSHTWYVFIGVVWVLAECGRHRR